MNVRLESTSGGYTKALPQLEARDRLLSAIWRLEAPGPNGIAEDVEAICVAVVVEVGRRCGRDDRNGWDEMVAHLLGEAVILHRKYDPEKRKGTGSFSGYLYDRLRYRLIDYWRQTDGKHGGKVGREILVDFTIDRYEESDGGGDTRALRLQQAGGAVDDSWADAVGGVYAADDRVGVGPVRRVGVRTGGRTQDGAARPVAGQGGGAVNGGAGGARASFLDCECGWRTYLQPPNGTPDWHVEEFCPACRRSLTL